MRIAILLSTGMLPPSSGGFVSRGGTIVGSVTGASGGGATGAGGGASVVGDGVTGAGHGITGAGGGAATAWSW